MAMKTKQGNNIFITNIIFYTLTATIVIIVLLGIYASGIHIYHARAYPITILDDGWRVVQNDHVLEQTMLSEINTGVVNKQEKFILERELPLSAIPSASLSFHTFQSTVNIAINDEPMYSFGMDLYAESRMLPRTICYVPLPADYAGKTMRIELVSTEPIAFSGLGPFHFGNEKDLFNLFLEKRRLPFFIGTFLFIFGLFQLLWIPYILIAGSTNTSPLFSAFITMTLGIYILAFYNTFDLFTEFSTVNTMIEYISLYLLPCAIAGFFTSLGGRRQRLYGKFALVNLAFVFVVLTLHLFNIMHITQFLFILFVIIIAEAVPIVVNVIKNPTRRRRRNTNILEETADKFLSYGFIIFVCCGFINEIMLVYARFISGKESYTSLSWMIIGSIIFSICLVLHYFLHNVCALRAEATRQYLSQLAYSDRLTDLANRTKCEHVMRQLGVDKKLFTLVSFDLDNLKKINDQFGHIEGDRMIQTFASALRNCFADALLVGRMGGDEFIVILTDEQCSFVDDLLHELEKTLKSMNKDEKLFKYGVSYGCAKSTETQYGQRVYDIYMLADKRMYDMKKERHKKRGAMQ